jgi:hypothetical protein
VSYSKREAVEQRRRNWRIILGTIIIITIPFYCAGIFLWGTAPQRTTPTPQPSQPPAAVGTATPIIVTATLQGEASITPLPITGFPTIDQFPTFVIPTVPTVELATRFLSATPTFTQPTQAPVPTQAPQPTQPPPPTQPPITDTPLPFDTTTP